MIGSAEIVLKCGDAMKRNYKAFTLVELLVVVGVVAVLASILIPAVIRVRESARSAVCMSNLKQMGQIDLMYTADNHGYVFPYKYDGNSLAVPVARESEMTGSVSNLLPPVINKYLPIARYDAASNTWPAAQKGPFLGILSCPDQISGQFNTADQQLLGYGCNQSVHVDYDYTTANLPKKTLKRLTQIKRPSEVIGMMDVNQPGAGVFASAPFLTWTDDSVTSNTGELTIRTPSNVNKSEWIIIANVSDWPLQTDTAGTYIGRFRHGKLTPSPLVTDPTTHTTKQITGSVGMGNCLFVDGHVASLNYMELKLKNIATWY